MRKDQKRGGRTLFERRDARLRSGTEDKLCVYFPQESREEGRMHGGGTP